MQVPSVLPTTRTSFFDDETIKLGVKVWADTTHYPNRKLSRNIILEGILFRKSNKNPVFMKSCYYVLYDDRLVYYNNVRERKEKGFVLLETLKIDILDTNDTSKESNYGVRLIFNQKYEDIYCRSRETFDIWLEKLRPKCIFKDFAHNFGCQKVIGKGSFAKVYLAHKLDDKAEFAIKSFDKRGLEANDKNKQSLLLEISIMRILNHANILKVYEVYETDNHINLVLEILRGGELFERIVSRGSYSERDAAVLMKNLLSALEHLHSHGIMHRDIKPENLILALKEDDKNIKLADFGLASYVGMSQQLFTRCGTPGYVAPEVLDDLPYNEKVDIFSAGIIMYILLTGSSPFYGKSYNEILMKNKKCKISYDFTEFKHKPSASALSLLKKMLEKNHNERISATEALQHEWIVSEGGRHDSVDVGVDTGISNIPASVLDNMKRFQEESKGLFNMTRLKPKEMFDESKLVMKAGLITGRTDTLEESKIIGPESPSFVPKPLRKGVAAGNEDMRKMAILKHAESTLAENNKPDGEKPKPEKANQETKEGEGEGEGEDNDDDETDSFIGDEEESYSLRSNLEKLNNDLNNIRIQNDLVALSEKFTSPLSQKRMPLATQESKKGLVEIGGIRNSLMNFERGPLMKKNTTQ